MSFSLQCHSEVETACWTVDKDSLEQCYLQPDVSNLQPILMDGDFNGNRSTKIVQKMSLCNQCILTKSCICGIAERRHLNLMPQRAEWKGKCWMSDCLNVWTSYPLACTCILQCKHLNYKTFGNNKCNWNSILYLFYKPAVSLGL